MMLTVEDDLDDGLGRLDDIMDEGMNGMNEMMR